MIHYIHVFPVVNETVCFFTRFLSPPTPIGAYPRDALSKLSDTTGSEVWRMANRHNLIPYALEDVARPGSRESRVRPAPNGMRIRNERGVRCAAE